MNLYKASFANGHHPDFIPLFQSRYVSGLFSGNGSVWYFRTDFTDAELHLSVPPQTTIEAVTPEQYADAKQLYDERREKARAARKFVR